MGLVNVMLLLQADSVLWHKHMDTEELVLPIRPYEKAAMAVEDSLAAKYNARFEELSRFFDIRFHLLGRTWSDRVVCAVLWAPCAIQR